MQTCGHKPNLHRYEPMRLTSGRTVTLYLGPGSLSSTAGESQHLIEEGIREFAMVCGLSFIRVKRPNGARVRIEFRPDMSYLGLAYPNGLILLNSTRQLGDLENNRVAQALVCHELGHVFGLSHGGVRQDIMHPDLGRHWSVYEVGELQRRHREPEEPWHPTDRLEVGRTFKRLLQFHTEADQLWRKAAQRRNDMVRSGNTDGLEAANRDVQALLQTRDDLGRELRKQHREWWAINKKWNSSGVGGVVRI